MLVEKSKVMRKYFELSNQLEYFEKFKDWELHNKNVLYHLVREYEISIKYEDSKLTKSLQEVINYIFDCSID